MAKPPLKTKKPADPIYLWDGKDRTGRIMQGELRAPNLPAARLQLRRQGISVSVLKKKPAARTRRIGEKDLCMFTRQLATMLKAGVPLLQAFDIVARGHANPSVTRLLLDIRADVETGTSLAQAFRRYPQYFDKLFCNLVAAGEQAGILEELLARLATYKEKTLAVKGKIKSAMFYPAAVLAVAMIVTAVIMIWVVPSFKSVFESFGAELPMPTLVVIWLSDQFVDWWHLVVGSAVVSGALFIHRWRRSPAMQAATDRLLLKLPILGPVIRKSVLARWTRTLATMFSAGVPLVESLDSVGGASGSAVYHEATQKIAAAVASGISLTAAMQQVQVFPPMVTQMAAIGEESGALDEMLRKVAEFYEEEVDAAVASLSSLMEPVIMVVLGGLIGGLVIAMYLPIFKLGSVI
ncbi:MAG: type II secretion system F family protein [Burkholderiaceae bacterium]|nr:type II secretion system F family protein [Burkholderiaceae bacterium]